CSHVCNLLLIAVKSIIQTAFNHIKGYRPRPLCLLVLSFLTLNSTCSLALRRASSLSVGVGTGADPCGVTAATTPSICNASAWTNDLKRPALAAGGGAFPTPGTPAFLLTLK